MPDDATAPAPSPTAVPERVSAHRRISAPAATIFRIVTDPNMHVEIDGSGMLMAAPESKVVSAIGDSFVMHMDREALGDIPMGKYKVRNTITSIVPDELVEWTVGGVDSDPIGHVYGYHLAPVSDTETDVTSYCDWTNIIQAVRERATFPVVPVTALEKTLVKLDGIATAAAAG